MHSEYSLYTSVFVCDSINANKVPTAFYRVYSWRTSKLVYRQHRVLVGNVVKKHSCIFKSCSTYRSPLFFVLSSSQSSGWVVASETNTSSIRECNEGAWSSFKVSFPTLNENKPIRNNWLSQCTLGFVYTSGYRSQTFSWKIGRCRSSRSFVNLTSISTNNNNDQYVNNDICLTITPSE